MCLKTSRKFIFERLKMLTENKTFTLHVVRRKVKNKIARELKCFQKLSVKMSETLEETCYMLNEWEVLSAN